MQLITGATTMVSTAGQMVFEVFDMHGTFDDQREAIIQKAPVHIDEGNNLEIQTTMVNYWIM